MPEITKTTVKATAVRANDILIDVADEDLRGGKRALYAQPIVTGREVKTKNVTIKTTAGNVHVAGTADVTVEREVPTEDEKRAKAEQDVRDETARTLAKIASWGDENPAEKLAAQMAADSDVVNWLKWNAEGTIKAGVRYGIGRNVRRMIDETDLGLAEMYDAMVSTLTQDVMRAARYPESSTSTMHNLASRLEIAVKAEILDDWNVKGVDFARRTLASI